MKADGKIGYELGLRDATDDFGAGTPRNKVVVVVDIGYCFVKLGGSKGDLAGFTVTANEWIGWSG